MNANMDATNTNLMRNTIGNATPRESQAGEISLWMTRLSDAIARTHDGTLRLSPFINPATRGVNSEQPVPPLCPVADQLRAMVARLEETNDAIESVQL